MIKQNWVVLSVDPGFGGTGLAMFVDGGLYKFANIREKDKTDDRYVEVSNRCISSAIAWLVDLSAVQTIYTHIGFTIDIVIESPHAMGGVKGLASLLRGDVFKVAKLAGAIGASMSILLDQALAPYPIDMSLHYPEVRRWKGQLPKDVTKKRVLRDVVYANKYITSKHYELTEDLPSHIFDAVGLGMWYIKQGDTYEN